MSRVLSQADEERAVVPVNRPEASDYFELLFRLCSSPVSINSYLELYSLLQNVCEDLSAEYVFPNLFSRLGYVCRQGGLTASDTLAVQNLRRKCHHVTETDLEETVFRSDVRLMAEFVGKVLKSGIPKRLSALFPVRLELGKASSHKSFYKVLRVVVKHWDERFVYAEKDDGEDDALEVRIDLLQGGYDGDLLYVLDLLKPDVVLNLLKTKVADEGVYIPETIVFQADYLIEVSALAACFKEYGHHPINYILSRLQPHQDTDYTLLGQTVGIFLDDLLNRKEDKPPVTYAASVRKAFRQMPLQFAFGGINGHFNFHEEARRQFANLQALADGRLERDFGFRLPEVLVEPSFLCEALGLSGRMDFLQSDYSKLVEQKSGKMDEFRHTHREPHFVQMMLYQAILEYNIGVSPMRSDAYLLYSKYAEGMLREQPYRQLLREAMALRNRIVAQEMECAENSVGSLLKGLQPDQLRTGKESKLWTQYQRPQLETFLRPFQVAKTELEELVMDYFCRFYTFLCRELLLSKMSTPAGTGRAFADLWNLPARLRSELGGLYRNMRLGEIKGTELSPADILRVSLRQEQTAEGVLSNFRPGDSVLLYRHDGSEEPDVRRQFLMRGNISGMKDGEIVIELRHPQRNRKVFEDSHARFAVEHDMLEASTNRLFANLYAFLSGSSDRQELLLNRRPLRREKEIALKGDYGAFNGMVEMERRSRDLFFVIGPPGSGKTSFALRYMVEEELRNRTEHILLMAYTNQAVDELCGMLDRICRESPELLPDYLRIGSSLTSDSRYHPRFLSEKSAHLNTAEELRRLVSSTSVFVGTVSSMSSQAELLRNLHFSVAFVDEASQILEPQLLGLFFAHGQSGKGEQNSIGRFVLVGDQKQLPAVVLQSPSDSKVKEPGLRAVGLTDCRNSLFERLLAFRQKSGDTEAYFLLEKQGRMHPGLFSFVNSSFYQNRLRCVPVPHQEREVTSLYPLGVGSPVSRMLSACRTAFIDCRPDDDGTNDKTNPAEARLAVFCMKELRKLCEANGRKLEAGDVGVIVPYRNQISAVRLELERQGLADLAEMTIDTVERFQGSQRNFIFYLFTVRHVFQLGFLSAATYLESSDSDRPYWVDRKLNVALTRAREQMFLIGNAALLGRNAIYRNLVGQLREQGCFFEADKLFQRM